jgi:hypothetical protein
MAIFIDMKIWKIAILFLTIFFTGCAPSYPYIFLISEKVEKDTLLNESVVDNSPNDLFVQFSQNDSTRQIQIMPPYWTLYRNDFENDYIIWYKHGLPYKKLNITYDKKTKTYQAHIYEYLNKHPLQPIKETIFPVNEEMRPDSSSIVFKIDLGGKYFKPIGHGDYTDYISIYGYLPNDVPFERFQIRVFEINDSSRTEIPYDYSFKHKMETCSPHVWVGPWHDDNCKEILANNSRNEFSIYLNYSANANEIVLYKDAIPFQTIELSYEWLGEKIENLKATTNGKELETSCYNEKYWSVYFENYFSKP